MLRMTICLSESDLEDFERGRASMDMSKSSYIRFLIAEHENRVPYHIRHKTLVDMFSQVNDRLKELLVSNKLSDVEKIRLFESIKELRDSVNKYIHTVE